MTFLETFLFVHHHHKLRPPVPPMRLPKVDVGGAGSGDVDPQAVVELHVQGVEASKSPARRNSQEHWRQAAAAAIPRSPDKAKVTVDEVIRKATAAGRALHKQGLSAVVSEAQLLAPD